MKVHSTGVKSSEGGAVDPHANVSPSRSPRCPSPSPIAEPWRWGAPESADFDALLAELARVNLEVGPPILVSFVAADAGVPRPETALAWGGRLSELLDVCASIHMVFEGTGFSVGVKRSVLTGMLMTARRLGAPGSAGKWGKWGKWVIHASLDAAVGALDPRHRADLTALATKDASPAVQAP